jgi:rod shape determining protein RodA
MRIDEYLDAVCGEIRWKAARKQVRDEIRAHIEQRAEEYASAGDSREKAEEKAVAGMGDAARTGKELDRLHRPRYDWVLIGSLVALLLVGIFQTITVGVHTNNRWIAATAAGLATYCFFSMADLRGLLKSKAFAPILYGLCIVGLIFLCFAYMYLIDHSSIAFNFLPALLSVGMLLSVARFVTSVRTRRGMLWLAAAVAAGAAAMFFVPAAPETMAFLICAWVMLWMAKIKGKGPVIVSLTALAILALAILLTYQWYSFHRLIRSFSEPEGAGFFLWQVRYRIAGLNWFGAGNSTPSMMSYATYGGEYDLLGFMWRYGIAAGMAVVGLCGVVLWRVFRMMAGVRDTMGRTAATGLCTFIAVQIAWNIAVNVGLLPGFMSSYLPMFAQVWPQTLVFGSIMGIMVGLYRKKDTYNTQAAIIT